MMEFSKMRVTQNNSIYSIFTPQNLPTATLAMPQDGQYVLDHSVIVGACKALNWRWNAGVDKKSNNNGGISSYSNMLIRQVGVSSYQIFLPNEVLVAEVITPPDGCYIKDSECLTILCKALALRYGVIRNK